VLNVLIIDSDTLMADFTVRVLRAEKYRVKLITDGIKGFEEAQSYSYDAVILDSKLPSMDGLTICSKLRRMKITTPILLLSHYGDENSTALGLDAGADDYIVKPFSRVVLSARLRAITRRPSIVTQSTFKNR